MSYKLLKKFILLEAIETDRQATFEENYRIVAINSKVNIGMLRMYFSDETPTFRETIKEAMKKKILQLSKYRIKSVLGCGTFKCAYLLDNDHVLVIGRSSHASKEYEKLMQKQFSSEGSVADIGVFDYGKAAEEMFYAEMSRIIPLQDWYIFTRNLKSRHPLEIQHLDVFLVALRFIIFAELYEHDADYVAQNIFKIIQNAVKNKWARRDYKSALEKANDILNPKEIRAITKAILNNIKKHGNVATIDVHSANIGVDMQNPDRMTVFDID